MPQGRAGSNPAPPIVSLAARRVAGTYDVGAVVRTGAFAAGVLGGLTLAACSAPWAPGSDASRATMLYVAFVQSSRYHYHVTLEGTASVGQGSDRPIDIDSSANVTWRITGVDAAGNTTIDVALDNLRTTVTGSVLPGSTTTTTTTSGSQHRTITVAPSGEIVSGGGTLGAAADLTPFPGISPPGADQFLAVLPDHSVKPGDTWSKSVTLPGPPGQPGITFTTSNRFLRYDTLKTGRAAVVETRADVPIDTTVDLGQPPAGVPGAPPSPAVPQPGLKIQTRGTLSFDSTTWFDTRTHLVERTRSVTSSDMTTSLSGSPLPQPPGGSALFPGTVHTRAKQTLQLDLLS